MLHFCGTPTNPAAGFRTVAAAAAAACCMRSVRGGCLITVDSVEVDCFGLGKEYEVSTAAIAICEQYCEGTSLQALRRYTL